MSLFQKMVESNPTKYPSRMGKKWDDDEVAKLLSSIQKKKTIENIANEHQRTIGAIESQQRKLAVAYWFNDKRPIDEISRFTGLTSEQIEWVIKGRIAEIEHVNKKATATKPKHVSNIVSDNPNSDMKEVVSLLKDIKSMLSVLIEKA